MKTFKNSDFKFPVTQSRRPHSNDSRGEGPDLVSQALGIPFEGNDLDGAIAPDFIRILVRHIPCTRTKHDTAPSVISIHQPES